MNRKTIFGNSTGFIVNEEIKRKIIDYLYLKLDLSKFRYIILNSIQKLKFLRDNDHYVSPNFKGYNYLILMLSINNINYCVAIDRKKLSYHKTQLDIKNIQIIQININTSDDLYNGTIFDGKLIHINNQYLFLIQDCFYLNGIQQIDIEMNQKINKLDIVLKENFKKDTKSYCDNFDFKLNKLYNYTDLETMINNLPNLHIPTNGIIFYPKLSGINILHIEKKPDKINISTTNVETIETNTYHVIHDFVDFLKSRSYSYELDGKYKILLLSRTTIPDVYDITEKINGDKLGIALIPNLKISHLCDSIINDTPVKFNCVYSIKFKKWIPLNTI